MLLAWSSNTDAHE